ncbi:KpsF/GutQ family sugar-phosphate isomerase [Skermanella sp. TT6]|uniref:KpsF/GutQ family sugar-phosphate isomerase n=1 Tax=Skermanella cutis TaxID=2775420 RepID=A0ABX7BHJ3_9PROT|nr:KpsF/GutQ family sugar-phosphate isomerase [Skermanella sp. TT6]QQP92551.1 KpsF/GutQ family sugar-phosphate isomerase [Skermanella sp. TT6]
MLLDGDIAVAGRVLRLEAEALIDLAAGLDAGFGRAVGLLGRITGRVVVTGMGKSGHVARKIAATLASTGTPALWVHPGEASHGDLGMIGKDDAVIALSNSGDTAELADIVAYAKRFRIPLIGITRRAHSSLAEQSDVALILPSSPEACPLGLAPTTSTTMMMALGDALAVALLERRGFSAADFKVFHPGGQLGRQLLRVTELMHREAELPLAPLDIRVCDAILVMTAKSFGCVGLTGPDGRLAGIITDGDLRRHMNPDLLGRPAASVMTADPKTIRPSALAGEALGIMNAMAITSLFVTDDGRPVGIIHIHDCLRAGVA